MEADIRQDENQRWGNSPMHTVLRRGTILMQLFWDVQLKSCLKIRGGCWMAVELPSGYTSEPGQVLLFQVPDLSLDLVNFSLLEVRPKNPESFKAPQWFCVCSASGIRERLRQSVTWEVTVTFPNMCAADCSQMMFGQRIEGCNELNCVPSPPQSPNSQSLRMWPYLEMVLWGYQV